MALLILNYLASKVRYGFRAEACVAKRVSPAESR